MGYTITLTSAGSDTGPFDLYSDLDNYQTPFDIDVDKSDLLAGYLCLSVPITANNIKVMSAGICISSVYMIVPTTTTTTTSP